MKRFLSLRRYGKRTMILFVVVASLGLFAAVSGVYAAFMGGGIRPSTSTDIDLQKGLVGHWKFDGNARDSTPNANNGTVTSATLVADRKAKASAAYTFNGSSAYITVPDSNVLTQTTITGSAWVNPSSTGTLKNIFSKASNNEYRIRLTATNTVQVLDRGATNIVTTTATVPINQWSLITFTGDSSGIKIYINGQLSTSGGAAFAPTNTTGVLTLGGNAANNELFGGAIDDIRLYSRVLSASEISALYNSYDTALKTNAGEKGLVGQWKLNGNAKDSSPNAFDGTATSTSASTDRKNTSNAAMSFTGASGSYVSITNNAKQQVASGTLSAWVKPTGGGSGFQGIIVKQSAYGIFLNGSTLVTYDWGAGVTRSTGVNLTNGVWYHVAMSFQNGVTNGTVIYINGSPVLTTTITVLAQSSGISLGSGFFAGNGQNLPGSIDDARMYNRVLSGSEVDYLAKSYNAQVNLHAHPTSSGGTNLSTGLRGWWQFNGNARDATPYANNASLVSAPTLATDRKGRANSAYTFNGTSQYMSAGTNTALSFTDNFTISAWVNPTSYHTTGYFGLKNGVITRGPATTFNYALQVNDATSVSFIKRTGAESLQFSNFTGIPSMTNQWTLLTAVVSGGTVKLYVNGGLHATLSVGTIAPVAGDVFYIAGSAPSQAESYFIGKLDDIRVYGRALTAAEITSLFSTYY